MGFGSRPIRRLMLDLEKGHPGVAGGNKAANLARLRKMGMRTPKTWVIPWQAYLRYLKNDVAMVEQLRNELGSCLSPQERYAVRSSASLEDSIDHSFAGQFKTVLDVPGGDAVLQAVWAVWATAQTPEVQQYLRRRALDDSVLNMAVLVQEMVRPVFSGVAFSRNPLTGMRETVIEAVEGLGTRLVQEGATPLRWVYHSGKFTTHPRQSDLPQPVVEEIVTGARKIARKMGRDVDLEWVYDGSAVYWVQMREITSLRNVRVYSNALAREMIGGLIKPLIWSINIPLVGGVWIQLMSELLGPNKLTPEDLVRSFYYRAYFNMGLLGELFEDLGFPAESLEMMWGLVPDGSAEPDAKRGRMKMMPGGMPPMGRMMRLLPRGVRFLWGKQRLLARLERRLPELENIFRAINLQAVANEPPQAVLRRLDALIPLAREAAYLNVIVPMLMYMYSALLRRQFARVGVDITLVDFEQDRADFQRFNPNAAIERLRALLRQLPEETRAAVRRSDSAGLVAIPGAETFAAHFAAVMEDFGALGDHGNDFSCPPWRETPDLILRLVTDFPPGSAAERPGVDKLPFHALPVKGLRRKFLGGLYRRARRLMLHREHISYVYTFGYGLFRAHFLSIARALAAAGALDTPNDIYFLSLDEVRKLVEAPGTVELKEAIALRKEEIDRVRDVHLPDVIYGDEAPPLKTCSGEVLRGTATSRGYKTGTARIVTGLADFPRVQPGDVLVIPYSDVGWTPLFTRAGAVVAEAGGMLSHSSIVAREYGIPAVVSVPGATSLPDGALVSVNGFTGEIIVHDGGQRASTAC